MPFWGCAFEKTMVTYAGGISIDFKQSREYRVLRWVREQVVALLRGGAAGRKAGAPRSPWYRRSQGCDHVFVHGCQASFLDPTI